MNYVSQTDLVTTEEIDNMLQRCGLFSLNYMALRLNKQHEPVESKRRTGRTTLAMMECLVLAEKGYNVGFLCSSPTSILRTLEVYCVRLGLFFTEEKKIIVTPQLESLQGVPRLVIVEDNK